MPKMKTNKGAAKRFKKRGSGSLKFRRGFRNHILTKKATKKKRQWRPLGEIKACDRKSVERMLCDE